jgi:hypothetical protein
MSAAGRLRSNGQPGSYQLAGRISTDKRACIEWSGQLKGGRLVGVDSSVSVEHLSARQLARNENGLLLLFALFQPRHRVARNSVGRVEAELEDVGLYPTSRLPYLFMRSRLMSFSRRQKASIAILILLNCS